MKNIRYFLDQDNSGHYYIVQNRKRKEWEAWNNLPDEDEAGWVVPDFAERLDRHQSCLTFTDPKI